MTRRLLCQDFESVIAPPHPTPPSRPNLQAEQAECLGLDPEAVHNCCRMPDYPEHTAGNTILI